MQAAKNTASYAFKRTADKLDKWRNIARHQVDTFTQFAWKKRFKTTVLYRDNQQYNIQYGTTQIIM